MTNIINDELEEKALELRRSYQREWRAKNKAKIKEYDRRKWLKKATIAVSASENGENNSDERKDT